MLWLIQIETCIGTPSQLWTSGPNSRPPYVNSIRSLMPYSAELHIGTPSLVHSIPDHYPHACLLSVHPCSLYIESPSKLTPWPLLHFPPSLTALSWYSTDFDRDYSSVTVFYNSCTIALAIETHTSWYRTQRQILRLVSGWHLESELSEYSWCIESLIASKSDWTFAWNWNWNYTPYHPCPVLSWHPTQPSQPSYHWGLWRRHSALQPEIFQHVAVFATLQQKP